MTAKVLNLERGTGKCIKLMLFAAALMLSIPYSCGPPTMLSSVPPLIGVTVMASKPKPEAEEKKKEESHGYPFPLDHFGNEPRFNPDPDMSSVKELEDRIAEQMSKPKKK